MKIPGVSCIIPFYNEGQRVFPVLNIINRIDEIHEIICVDDGSLDNMFEAIREKFPEITLIRLNQNLGKADAIKNGILQSKNKFILLIDADLLNLNPDEIKATISTIKENQEIDMIIMRRINAPWYIKIYRVDLLFSGERILKKKDLISILEKEVKGYELEMAINLYMLKKMKSVYWYPSSATNTYKIKKNGLLNGLKKEIKMFYDVIKYCGPLNFIKLYTTFGRKKIN